VSTFMALSKAERIVYLFHHLVFEAHKHAICTPCEMDPDEFDDVIARARDIGAERGLFITPIYEREGWWTSAPSDRILGLAMLETSKRNIGEVARTYRLANARAKHLNTKSSERLAEGAGLVHLAYKGGLSNLREELPEVSIQPESDYVLSRVDSAVVEGKGYVSRDPRAAA
jgi:hypothetical protein